MKFPLQFDGRTSEGFDIGVVHLPHSPIDAIKLVDLRESMIRHGWTGRPVILIELHDYHLALSGIHRLCAAVGLQIEIDALIYESDVLGEELVQELQNAGDDDDLYAILSKHELEEAIEVMRQEIFASG